MFCIVLAVHPAVSCPVLPWLMFWIWASRVSWYQYALLQLFLIAIFYISYLFYYSLLIWFVLEISCSGDVEWRHIEYTLRKFKNTLKMLCFSKSSSFNLIKYDSLSEFVDANSWKISHVQNWIFRVEYLSLFPLLIHVNLSYNDSLIDSDILNLLSCCQHLSEINVSYCPKITAQSIICIANVPQSIVFFDCEGNYQLCGVDFIVMASRQRRIQHFNITGVSSVGVCEFVVCLAENNGQSLCALLLTDLHIDHHVLRALSCNCPCLSLLSITETSDDHLEIGIPLLAGCESLSVLLISNCSAIVQQSLSALIDVYVEID